jgi:hypothetical protein
VDDKPEPEPQQEENEEADEEQEEFQEEHFEAEEVIVEPPVPFKTDEMTSKISFTKPTFSPYKYKDDEKKWDPIFKSSKYVSNGYNREELIVEPPASFDGSDGTYQVSFENNNSVLVVKIAPNSALSDPHDVNGYYRQKYGIVTAADSARDQAFKASARGLSDKWYTFRHHLDWPGKPSEDGMMPWLDFADIDSQGRVFPLLIINLCSIKPIEEMQRKVTGGLKRNKFKSPPKVKGVNMAGDKTAQMASLLEEMINTGALTDDMKKSMRRVYQDGNDMDLGDAENNNNKRPYNNSSNNTVA